MTFSLWSPLSLLKPLSSFRNDNDNGYGNQNDRAARAARIFEQFPPVLFKTATWMTNFKVLTRTLANYSESFSLTLYFKSVLINPVIGNFAHIEEYKQDGIIMKYLE